MVTDKDVGQRVKDSAGRVGILRAVLTDWEDPAKLPPDRRKQTLAFLWPEGGGREWTAPPRAVERI